MKSVTTPTPLISATCLCLVSLLSACEVAPTAGRSEGASSGSVFWSLAKKNDDSNCFTERLVQPPRGAHRAKNGGSRPVPSYFFEGPWAEYLELETLSVKLNERDINHSVDLDSGELRFTNPGKSRAVIDVTYCLSDAFPGLPDDNDSSENDDTSEGDDAGAGDDMSNDVDEGGVIVVVDPCESDSECTVIGY